MSASSQGFDHIFHLPADLRPDLGMLIRLPCVAKSLITSLHRTDVGDYMRLIAQVDKSEQLNTTARKPKPSASNRGSSSSRGGRGGARGGSGRGRGYAPYPAPATSSRPPTQPTDKGNVLGGPMTVAQPSRAAATASRAGEASGNPALDAAMARERAARAAEARFSSTVVPAAPSTASIKEVISID